MHHAWTDDV